MSAQAETTVKSFDDLLSSVAEECGWPLEKVDDESVLEITTHDNRRQKVFVSEDVDIAGQPIVRYWSIIGVAEELDYRKLLEENARLDYGTFAVRGDHLILADTQLIQDADPLEVGTTISYLASYADRYELAIYGTDEY